MLHVHMIERIRGEYLEMPGLRLTVDQAERLCGVNRHLCKAVLDALVDAGFLTTNPTGLYVRATEGAVRHRWLAKLPVVKGSSKIASS